MSYLSSKHATSWFPAYQVRFSIHFFSNKKLFIYILPQNFAIFVGKTRHPSVPSISNPVCFSIFFSLKTYCFPFSKQITSMLYLTVSLTTWIVFVSALSIVFVFVFVFVFMFVLVFVFVSFLNLRRELSLLVVKCNFLTIPQTKGCH